MQIFFSSRLSPSLSLSLSDTQTHLPEESILPLPNEKTRQNQTLQKLSQHDLGNVIANNRHVNIIIGDKGSKAMSYQEQPPCPLHVSRSRSERWLGFSERTHRLVRCSRYPGFLKSQTLPPCPVAWSWREKRLAGWFVGSGCYFLLKAI